MQGGVRKKGNRWYYYFEAGVVNGKRNKIERAGGATKKEAQEKLRQAILEFETTGSVLNNPNISVADYLDYWMDNYVRINLKYNPIDNYERMIRLHINPHIGIYHLKRVTPGTVQELVNLKFQEGFAKQTLSILRGLLNKAFKMAVHPWQLIKENPMQYIEPPKYQMAAPDRESMRIISFETFDKILEVAPKSSNFHIPLQIGFHTGMRRSEVTGLAWGCVDLERRTIKVEKIPQCEDKEWVYRTPKTASSHRTIEFGETLYQILRKHRVYQMEMKLKYGKHYVDHNSVCAKENGERLTNRSIKWGVDQIQNKLDIPFNFHALRHTHATILMESGAKDKAIQKRLGHSRVAVTVDTYSHLTDKTISETVDIFEKRRQQANK